MRVVSLLPSATETVCVLGRGADLVGRSEECDFPIEVRQLPVVMRARTLDSARPSAEIDERVRSARSDDQSLYELDIELLARLTPELVLTQDLCRVCSVTNSEVGAACEAAGVDPRIVTLTPRALSDVWESVETVGQAVKAEREAVSLADQLRREATSTSAPPSGAPRVAVIEWVDPPIIAGLWTPEMIRAAGGHAVLGASGEPGVRTTWPDVESLQPDLVVVSPCSFGVERTRREIAQTPEALASLSRLRPPAGIWIADEAHFSRPGPRLIEGIRLLRALLGGVALPQRLPVERWAAGGRSG